MPKHLPIEPKPTQYGNTLFRSRLEARWAVFFDFTENVLNWEYEPCTFRLPNGWDYTPDFRIRVCLNDGRRGIGEFHLGEIYVEVKPTKISPEYKETISKFARHCEILILVVEGGFYGEDDLQAHIYPPGNVRPRPFTLGQIFSEIDRGVYHARHFRFDLK